MVDLKMEVYSPALELIGFLEVQKSVIWEEKAFSAGSFSVESLITSDSLKLLQPENIIWIEGETAGIIEYVQEQSGKDGPYITVKGHTLTGILARRILWGKYQMYETVPVIMHQLVDDCAINPTRGDVEARKIPGLVLLDAPTGGDKIRIQKTGGTLLDELEHLGSTYGVAFGVRFNAAIPQMEFWTRWGKNLTVHQSDNPQVFYSTELDDVLESEYSYNSQNYRNVSLVAGEDSDDGRVYVTVENEIEETPDTPVNPPEPPEPVKYTVTLLVDPAGGGVASGGKIVAAGVSVTVNAAPSDGYTFTGWSENGEIVSTSSAYTFTVNANRTLTAVFAAVIPVYTITATIDPAGSGTVTGAGQYQEGQTVTLVATVADGYKFTGWQENGQTVSTDTEYSFTATGNRTLTAVFAVVPASRLPDGYTEVEYIQSSGTFAAIDTNIKPTKTIQLVMDVEPVDTATSSNKYFFYSNYVPTSGNKFFFLGTWSTNGVRVATGENATSAYFINLNSNTTCRRMTIDINCADKKASVDGDEKQLSNVNTSSSMRVIRLLCTNSTTEQLHAKIFSCKIYDHSNTNPLLRDFVPCINPSNAVGLYDLVENKFYGRLSSTSGGEFISGPAV